jgi:hypothetical protein
MKVDNGSMVGVEYDWAQNDFGSIPEGDAPEQNDKVDIKSYNAEYYKFSVDAFGWYNIDMVLDQMEKAIESRLVVKLEGDIVEKVEVFLIIPEYKVFIQGGFTGSDKQEFAFEAKDGTIKLPYNSKAYILAMSDADNSISFALREFMIKESQDLFISLKMSNKEQFEAAVRQINNGPLAIVSESRNKGQIEKLDMEIDALNSSIKTLRKLVDQKDCNCECSGGGLIWSDSSRVQTIDTTAKD